MNSHNEANSTPSAVAMQEVSRQAAADIRVWNSTLRSISRGLGFSFRQSNEFAIDRESGEATYDIEFWTKQGYSSGQIVFALLHEIRAHLVKTAKLRSTPEGEKEYQELRTREKLIPWMRIWENSREDASGNASILDEIAPVLAKDAASLYRDKLFPNRDYTNLPMHMQFIYAVLLKTMLPYATDIQLSPNVQEELEKLKRTTFTDSKGIEYEGNVIAFITAPESLAADPDSTREKLWVSKTMVEPVIALLFEEDKQQAQNHPEWQGKGGGQGGEQSQGPFNGVYEDYNTKIHPELDGWDDDQIDEKVEKFDVDASQRVEAVGVLPEGIHQDKAAQVAFAREYGLSSEQMRVLLDYDTLVKRITPFKEELRKMFRLLREKRKTIKPRVKTHQFYGRRHDIVRDYINLQKHIHVGPTRKNWVEETIEEEVPFAATWHMVADQSISMGDPGTQAQLMASVLYLETLASFEEDSKTDASLSIQSDIRGFGVPGQSEQLRTYKTTNQSLDYKTRFAIFEGLSKYGGGTNDYESLAQILQEINNREKLEPGYLEALRAGKRKEMVIIFSDGQSANPTKRQEQIKALTDLGVIVMAPDDYGIFGDPKRLLEFVKGALEMGMDVLDKPIEN